MTILQVNRKRGHKFLVSGALFGFCMARITTCVMRIVWSTRPLNIRVGIAATIFVYAGVILLFVINLIFAQRIIRAARPGLGWNPIFSKSFILLYVLIVVTLVMLITSVIQTFYTLNSNTRRIDRDISLYAQTYYLSIAFLPIPLIIFGLVIPRKTRVEKFGSGRFRTKVVILLLSSSLLTLGSGFRTGTAYMNPRPRADPAWYHSKACFYLFNLTIEYVVVLLYVIVRVDMRFHVPDGSKGPGYYSGQQLKEAVANNGGQNGLGRIMTEGEVFDDAPEDEHSNPNSIPLQDRHRHDADKDVERGK